MFRSNINTFLSTILYFFYGIMKHTVVIGILCAVLKIHGGEVMYKKLHKPTYYNNLREMLYSSAERYSNKNAFHIREKDGTYRYITFSQFKREFRILGNHLLNMGLEDKRIAVIGKNSYRWVLHYLSAVTVGVVVPIDKELSTIDMKNFIISADCSAVFADEDMVEGLKAILDEKIKVISLNDPLPQIDENDNRIDNIPVSSDDMSILIFTSGTTGSSKGVCLSQKNICSNIYSTSQIVKVTDKDKTLSILPLHHTYECTLDCLLILSKGACISYADGLSRIKANIVEYKPTLIVVVPALLTVLEKRIVASIIKDCPKRYKKLFAENSFPEAMAKLPFIVRSVIKKKVKQGLGGRLHTFIVGAAELSVSVIESFEALGIRTLQGYGLTECSPLLAGNSDFFFNAASIGKAIPGVELIIDEPNEYGVGEILAKGDNIMLGYYNGEEATRKAFKNGYFRTGDLGCIDESGALYFKGRLKNVIVTLNGKNIYPEELENRLLENELVAEVIVVASEDNGDTKVKAKIFPNIKSIAEKIGHLPSKEEIYNTIKSIIDEVNKKIPSYKHIRIFEILEHEFEKTTTRKIMRYGVNVN